MIVAVQPGHTHELRVGQAHAYPCAMLSTSRMGAEECAGESAPRWSAEARRWGAGRAITSSAPSYPLRHASQTACVQGDLFGLKRRPLEGRSA